MDLITIAKKDWDALVAEIDKLLDHEQAAVVEAAQPVKAAADAVAATAAPAPAAAT